MEEHNVNEGLGGESGGSESSNGSMVNIDLDMAGSGCSSVRQRVVYYESLVMTHY